MTLCFWVCFPGRKEHANWNLAQKLFQIGQAGPRMIGSMQVTWHPSFPLREALPSPEWMILSTGRTCWASFKSDVLTHLPNFMINAFSYGAHLGPGLTCHISKMSALVKRVNCFHHSIFWQAIKKAPNISSVFGMHNSLEAGNNRNDKQMS